MRGLARAARPKGVAVIAALWAWLVTARLRRLPTYVTPVLVGSALAARDGHLRLAVLAGGLVIASLLRQGIRFVNDWEDVIHGVDQLGQLRPEHSLAQVCRSTIAVVDRDVAADDRAHSMEADGVCPSWPARRRQGQASTTPAEPALHRAS